MWRETGQDGRRMSERWKTTLDVSINEREADRESPGPECQVEDQQKSEGGQIMAIFGI